VILNQCSNAHEARALVFGELGEFASGHGGEFDGPHPTIGIAKKLWSVQSGSTRVDQPDTAGEWVVILRSRRYQAAAFRTPKQPIAKGCA
jgi:hypothetical protein